MFFIVFFLTRRRLRAHVVGGGHCGGVGDGHHGRARRNAERKGREIRLKEEDEKPEPNETRVRECARTCARVYVSVCVCGYVSVCECVRVYLRLCARSRV